MHCVRCSREDCHCHSRRAAEHGFADWQRYVTLVQTGDRTPCHDAREQRKERGFSSALAANAAGHIHVPMVAREKIRFMAFGAVQRAMGN
jgi:hypothetical protein